MKENIVEFVRLISEVHNLGPIVEFGSKIPDNQPYADLRQFFLGIDYLGVDVVLGPGVDLVDDITASSLNDSYGTIIACETLEHVDCFWKAVPEVASLLKSQGLFILSVPSMVFPIHHLPDYWRFTPQGIQFILDDNFGKNHSFILFQGDFRMPHTIMAVASYSDVTLAKVVEYIEPKLDRIPAIVDGDYIYVWEGPDAYARQWTFERNIVGDMEQCVIPIPEAFNVGV